MPKPKPPEDPKEKDPIDLAIDQIELFLAYFRDLQLRPFPNELPAEFSEYLENVKNISKMYDEMNANLIKEAGISKKEIDSIIRNPPNNMGRNEKRRLERITRVKKDVENFYKAIKDVKEGKSDYIVLPPSTKEEEKGPIKKQAQVRGMRKGWKRL